MGVRTGCASGRGCLPGSRLRALGLPRGSRPRLAPAPYPGTHIQNGPVAVVAARREEVVIVLFTVGLSIPLEEVPGADLLLAVGADEVLRVPGPPHGRHHLTRAWGCGSGPAPPPGTLPPAPLAGPSPHHLPRDRLFAGPADSFGDRGDPQFVQVRLQTPQHAVQLTPGLRGAAWGRAAPRLPLGHELRRQGERAGQHTRAWGAGTCCHRGRLSLPD